MKFCIFCILVLFVKESSAGVSSQFKHHVSVIGTQLFNTGGKSDPTKTESTNDRLDTSLLFSQKSKDRFTKLNSKLRSWSHIHRKNETFTPLRFSFQSIKQNTTIIPKLRDNMRFVWHGEKSTNRTDSGLLVCLWPVVSAQYKLMKQAVPFCATQLSQYLPSATLLTSATLMTKSGPKYAQYALWSSLFLGGAMSLKDTFSSCGAHCHSLSPRNDSYAVITGASSGLGAELSRTMYREGYNVVLIGSKREKLAALREELLSGAGDVRRSGSGGVWSDGRMYRTDTIRGDVGVDSEYNEEALLREAMQTFSGAVHYTVATVKHNINRHLNRDRLQSIWSTQQRYTQSRIAQAHSHMSAVSNTVRGAINSHGPKLEPFRKVLHYCGDSLQCKLNTLSNYQYHYRNNTIICSTRNTISKLKTHGKQLPILLSHLTHNARVRTTSATLGAYLSYLRHTTGIKLHMLKAKPVHTTVSDISGGSTESVQLPSGVESADLVTDTDNNTASGTDIVIATVPLSQPKRDVQIVCCDLSNPMAAVQIAKELRKRGVDDKIDVLIHSAGRCSYCPLAADSLGALRDLVEVNVKSAVLLTRLLLPKMIVRAQTGSGNGGVAAGGEQAERVESLSASGVTGGGDDWSASQSSAMPSQSQPDDELPLIVPTILGGSQHTSSGGSGGSRILFVSASGAAYPSPNTAVYTASKAFLSSFGHSLRRELRPHSIMVTVAHPGAITGTDFLRATSRELVEDPPLAHWIPGMSMSVQDTASRIFSAVRCGRDSVTPGLNSKLFSHVLCSWLPPAVVGEMHLVAWGPAPRWMKCMHRALHKTRRLPFRSVQCCVAMARDRCVQGMWRVSEEIQHKVDSTAFTVRQSIQRIALSANPFHTLQRIALRSVPHSENTGRSVDNFHDNDVYSDAGSGGGNCSEEMGTGGSLIGTDDTDECSVICPASDSELSTGTNSNSVVDETSLPTQAAVNSAIEIVDNSSSHDTAIRRWKRPFMRRSRRSNSSTASDAVGVGHRRFSQDFDGFDDDDLYLERCEEQRQQQQEEKE